MSSPSVRLRKVREGDLPIFYAHQRDPEAVRMAAFPSRDREAFMAHWAKITREETVITRTIVAGGIVAGNIVSFMRGDTREMGYWLGREFWGRGIATKALHLFLSGHTARPLYAGVATHNAASLRVLEKCGFALSHQEGDFYILMLA